MINDSIPLEIGFVEQVKKTVFGKSATEPSEGARKGVDAAANSNWSSQTMGLGDVHSTDDKNLLKTTGSLGPEGKSDPSTKGRDWGRPEGIDQFGAENAERD